MTDTSFLEETASITLGEDFHIESHGGNISIRSSGLSHLGRLIEINVPREVIYVFSQPHEIYAELLCNVYNRLSKESNFSVERRYARRAFTPAQSSR